MIVNITMEKIFKFDVANESFTSDRRAEAGDGSISLVGTILIMAVSRGLAEVYPLSDSPAGDTWLYSICIISVIISLMWLVIRFLSDVANFRARRNEQEDSDA